MAEAVLRQPGEGGAADNPVGGQVAFKVRGEHTGGGLTAFETVVAPGAGPPLHVHANEDEALYVIEGDMRFKLGDDEVREAPAGSYVFVPRGVPHGFRNAGDAPARMLVHFTPAGMERFFDRFAAVDPPDPDAFARIGAGVGMEVVGPPIS